MTSLKDSITKLVLDNGLTVIVKEFHPASVLNLSVWVKAGSVNENDKNAGISHYIEHMLFKGTKKRQVGEIAKEIHAVGGYLNAFTHFECTCYWIVLPSRFLDIALDVQSDAILNPVFEKKELLKERKVILEELKMYEDRPESLCFEKLMGLAYTLHNYHRPIIGYEKSINDIKRDDMVGYYNAYYQPANMVVTLVGDVKTNDAIKKISKIFRWEKPQQLLISHSPPEPTQKNFRRKEYKSEIQRMHVHLGFHIPHATHDDVPACKVLAALLGEGRSSRFFLTLKEKCRLVDTIDVSVFAERDPGLFYIAATLDGATLSKMEAVLWEEISKIQTDKVSESELLKVKHMLESFFIFSQETVEGQGRVLGFYEQLGDCLLAEKYVERIYSVTCEDMLRVARRYLQKENCSMVVYAPKGAVKSSKNKGAN